MSWLESKGYRLVQLDAAAWSTETEMHSAIAEALDFPAYYGANLAALDDCLRDVAIQSYGWSEADTGLVLLVEGFDQFARRDEYAAHKFLDIYARKAATGALFGNRLMCLVKTGNPHQDIPDVGARSVGWNDREFLHSSRVDV